MANSNRKEFQKQLRRITQEIKKAQKLGYEVDESLVPELPKRVTQKKLEEITRVTRSSIYKVSLDIAKKGKEEVIKGGDIVTASQKYITSKGKKRGVKVEQPKHPRIKNPKKQTSEEEKHKRRSEGSKKGWETRRKNITNKQKSEFQQKAKEITQNQGLTSTIERPLDTVAPRTFDVLEAIRNRILETEKQLPIPTDRRDMTELKRRGFMSLSLILDDMASLGDERLNELTTYYASIEQELAEELVGILYASTQALFEIHFSRSAVLLRNNVPLSQTEAAMLEDTYNMVFDYE